MKQTSFAVDDDLIIVEASVSGPLGRRRLRLAVDTGAAMCLLVPEVVDEVGYSIRDADRVTSITSAIGTERGYTLHVLEFEALGFVEPKFLVHVFDLPNRHGLDGLLGLSFLRKFNFEIRLVEGRILAERAS